MALSENRICKLFQIEKPIIQAGMVWCAPWQLAAAVSNAGGLGIIGAASMYPEVLVEHVQKCKKATNKPFAVNLPLLYPDIDQHIETIIREKVPIVFTSAGNPKTWTAHLKKHGITVVHVCPGVKFAVKCQELGVDAVVAEGFEAGGHNGRDETTTFCLTLMVKAAVDIPVIAAGGIANGSGMLAAMALGADAVQIGTRFVASEESSAHPHFKQKVVAAKEGDTHLVMKKLVPVRLLKNPFYERILAAELSGADKDELAQILGRARAKKGMFEGDMEEGELEIGQISGLVNEIKPAKDIVAEIWEEFCRASQQLQQRTQEICGK